MNSDLLDLNGPSEQTRRLLGNPETPGGLCEAEMLHRFTLVNGVVHRQARNRYPEAVFTRAQGVSVRGKHFSVAAVAYVLLGGHLPEADQTVIWPKYGRPKLVPKGVTVRSRVRVLDDVRDAPTADASNTLPIVARRGLRAVCSARGWRILDDNGLIEVPRSRAEAISRLVEWEQYTIGRGDKPEPLAASLTRQLLDTIDPPPKRRYVIRKKDKPALYTILQAVKARWQVVNNVPDGEPTWEEVVQWVVDNPTFGNDDTQDVVD